MPKPSECRDMRELRAEIDRIDRDLVELLRQRADCIDRAIEIKAVEGLPARIEDRVEEVLAKVRSAAEAQGLDPALAAEIWVRLIEWSIAREQRVLGPDEGKAEE